MGFVKKETENEGAEGSDNETAAAKELHVASLTMILEYPPASKLTIVNIPLTGLIIEIGPTEVPPSE